MRIPPIGSHRELYVDPLKTRIFATYFVENLFRRLRGASDDATHAAGVVHGKHHIRSAGALSPHAGVDSTHQQQTDARSEHP